MSISISLKPDKKISSDALKNKFYRYEESNVSDDISCISPQYCDWWRIKKA